jgi:hypothetical protein
LETDALQEAGAHKLGRRLFLPWIIEDIDACKKLPYQTIFVVLIRQTSINLWFSPNFLKTFANANGAIYPYLFIFAPT